MQTSPSPGRLSWLTLVLTLLVATPLARAAGDGDGDGEEEEQPSAGRAATAVFVLTEDGVQSGVAAQVERALEGALKANAKLAVKDKDKLLAAFAGEVPEDAVAAARSQVEAGLRLLDLGRPADAVPKLEAGIAALEKVLGFVKKQELADAQLALGVARARAGATDAAVREFARLLTWRPAQSFDVKRYGAEHLPLYQQTAESIPNAMRGSLEIKSKPAGAQAFVNGRFVGVTPVTAEGLVAGHHYVTLKLAGYRPSVVKAHVDQRFQETTDVTLSQSEKYLLVAQSLAKAKAGLGSPDAVPGMLDLRAFLFIDMVVFARVKPAAAAKQYQVDAFVYDLRSKKRLGAVTSEAFAPAAAKKPMTSLSTALFTGVRYDGQVDAPKVVGKKTKKKGSILGKWWLWAGVGAVVAGGVVIAVVATGDEGASCISGSDCIEIVF